MTVYAKEITMNLLFIVLYMPLQLSLFDTEEFVSKTCGILLISNFCTLILTPKGDLT